MKCLNITRKMLYKIIAISLIIMSFVLYIIMPFNACLPFSACVIGVITGAMIVLSEIIFWIGSLMIGRDVALKIRRKISIANIVNYIKERKKGK